MREFKIRIFQPIVPHYRVALFEGIAKRYPAKVEIWAGNKAYGGKNSYQVAGAVCDFSHEFKKIGPFVWQLGLSLRGLRRGDVVVVCGDIHQLSTIFIAIRARMKRIRVVWWGHHKTAGAKRWRVAMRIQIMKWVADTVLFYTKEGVQWYASLGNDISHVYATENAIELDPMRNATTKWNEERLRQFAEEKGVVGKKLFLFCSRLLPKVKLELAIRALTGLERDCLLVVIGDGIMREKYERLACELGVSSKIRWEGILLDQDQLAPWFLLSKAFVYPGAIGLSIFHSFSYGLPVITHGNKNNQMPEFAAMIEGKTGLLFKEGDWKCLQRAMGVILADDKNRTRMSTFCKEYVFANFTMEKMVENFCRAIQDGERQ